METRFARLDRLTGEIVDIKPGTGKKRAEPVFLKFWQHKVYAERIDSLHGATLKILFYLLRVAKWGNQIPGSGVTAKAKQIPQSHVSRAYTELKRADIIKCIDGVYYLNMDFCWRGSEAQRKELYCAWGPDMDITKEG